MSAAFLALLAIAAALAAVNGANDAGKPVATLAGSGRASYRRAIVWGTLTTTAGAISSMALAAGLLRGFSSGFLMTGPGEGAREAAAAALAATAWVLLATWRRGPVSTTHAIAGGLIGAGIASGGVDMVRWGALGPRVFLPLAISPIAAALVGLAISPLVRRTMGRWRAACLCVGVPEPAIEMAAAAGAPGPLMPIAPSGPVARVGTDPASCATGGRGLVLTARPEHLHWLSAGATSFARGLNDAPKIAALALPLAAASHAATVHLAVAAAMAAGSVLGGARIARVLGERITRLDEDEGTAGNLATALLVLGASPLGLPVSTTHVATGAIAGTGLAGGAASVRWNVLRGIVLAWLVTLPAAALMGAAAVVLMARVG